MYIQLYSERVSCGSATRGIRMYTIQYRYSYLSVARFCFPFLSFPSYMTVYLFVEFNSLFFFFHENVAIVCILVCTFRLYVFADIFTVSVPTRSYVFNGLTDDENFTFQTCQQSFIFSTMRENLIFSWHASNNRQNIRVSWCMKVL